VVGRSGILQRHTLVDVAKVHADLIMDKLRGVRVKGQALHPALATAAHHAADSD
jgi:hypothetical protein